MIIMAEQLPNWRADFESIQHRLGRVVASGALTSLPAGRYLHWDQLKHRQPPRGLNHKDWWAAVKAARFPICKALALVDLKGRPFTFCPVEPILEMLHHIDSRLAGRIETSNSEINGPQRDRYLISSLIEEAITSSQLEGAATTRRVAADMIRSNRRPRGHDEQMILNNYRAMSALRTWRDEPLTPGRVLEIHRQITVETLEDASAAGRLQRPDEERVYVQDNLTQDVLHRPPPAEFLPERLEQLCQYANQILVGESFLHPVIHAIVLHFWLAWDHPFADGNGRTARALFYWKMLNSNYWLFEFISISSILKGAPGQYKRAFLRTESDENDLTYFILHQLEVITKAIKSLDAYLERKAEEMRRAESLLKTTVSLNHRQLALMAHALRHPSAEYSISSHQNSHDIAYATARSDLLELVDLELIDQSPGGRKPLRFFSPADLVDRIGERP